MDEMSPEDRKRLRKASKALRGSRRVRIEACRMTAQVLAGRPTEYICPTAWSLALFFESYILNGSEGTVSEFGPKDAVELKVLSGGR